MRFLRVAVALVALGGCGARTPPPPARAADRPAPRPRDAVIEGRVLDRDTGAPIAGVTVFAEWEPRESPPETAFSDAEGRYRLAVAAGPLTVSAYHIDARLDQAVVVQPAEVRALELRLVDADRHPELVSSMQCPRDPAAAPPTSADTDALIAAALLDGADHVLPRRAGAPRAQVLVHATDHEGARLSAAALPAVPGASFHLRTGKELQALADRTGAPVDYLGVAFLEIVGDCAAIEVAWSDAYPARDDVKMRCRCTAVTRYVRRAGRWVREQEGNATCG